MPPGNSDYLPTASWDVLRLRAKLLGRIRQFFAERDFLEVETPLLSADTVADLHLDPIPVTLFSDARHPESGRRLWLQTSPEFAMKRLLAAGGTRLFQVAKAFRGGEIGPRHNPEFTIIEWYRVGDDMQAGIQLLKELTEVVLAAGIVQLESYRDAFLRTVGLHPHVATVKAMAKAAVDLGLHPPTSLGNDRDQWLNFLLAEKVELELGTDRPTILYDYPASQAALARVRSVVEGQSTYEVAERFELYVKGMELANGYHELTESGVLIERNRAANAIRTADGRYEVPEESRLLDAMRQGLPPCSGVALGFDRLVMVAAGSRQLSEVMPFTIERA